jgi:hypothetical protein
MHEKKTRKHHPVDVHRMSIVFVEKILIPWRWPEDIGRIKGKLNQKMKNKWSKMISVLNL